MKPMRDPTLILCWWHWPCTASTDLKTTALASSLEEDADVVALLAGNVGVAGHGQGPVRGLDVRLRRIVVHAQDLCSITSARECLLP